MYITLDQEGRILSCNQVFADSLGYRKEELIGQSYFSFAYPDCRQDVEATLRRLFDGAGPI
jgi:PAS domain S-box-containing protein